MKLKTYNDQLPFVKENWKGNPLNEKGLYTNLEGDDIKNLKEVFKWFSGPRPLTAHKKNQTSPLSWEMISNLKDKSTNAIIPLGHAGFIIDLNSIRLVIDPIIVPNRFMKRYTKVPFKTNELVNVDYLLLSHNHRDHIDKNSVISLCKINPNAIILTGLEIEKILRKWGVQNQVQEAGWYQQFRTDKGISIDYLPAQHWSRRWLTDTNVNLWGSFMIIDKAHNKTIYFGSDSGYASHFKEIGNSYNIDIAMIGIGAYEPRWFMKTAHTSPADGVQVFKDLQAKKWIPMHYGTFDLSDEPIFYPEKVLKEQHQEELGNIIWMEIGKRVVIF